MSYQYRVDHGGVAASEVEVVVPSRHPSSGVYRLGLKRLFDLVVAVIIAAPVALLVTGLALLIARDGASPFYRQERVGLDGRRFFMVKLRSMVPDAEQALERHLAADPALRAEWDERQKLERDPRITPLGRVIRACSLDELPQLLNVLKGDMSLVGPRPMMVCQQEIYPGTEYYRMRPGITGFWQVSARNETGFRQRADFDRAYFQRMSFATDLRVLLQTVSVVLKATGR